MTYKIGQILTATEDIEVERAILGEKEVIPKGSKVIIGPDNLAHHFRDGSIQPLAKTDNVEGYDTSGLAEYLTQVIVNHILPADCLEDYEITKKDIQNEIEYSLDDIGF